MVQTSEELMKLFYQLTLIVTVIILMVGPSTLAQESISVTAEKWEANFREHLTFTVSAKSEVEITKVELFYQIVGQLAASRNEAKFTPGKSIAAEFKIDQTEPANYMPPGTEVEYWWKITDANDNKLKTDKKTLLYLDNRHDWQKLQNKRLTLYWYEGESDFGQRLFDRANQALDTLETNVGVTVEHSLKIFIYTNHQDLLDAVYTSAKDWTGGVAFTEFGVVVLGISPDQLEWGLKATTHEISHLVIHQAMSNSLGQLPTWLDEGIAVYNENQEQLDEDFRFILEAAVKKNDLMTLRSLTSPFPADTMLANLAYGESGAVVKFIIDTYGSKGMAKLLKIFAEGALPDEALQQALGVDTDGLDNAWRATLGLPPLPGTETKSATEGESLPESTSEKVAPKNTATIAPQPTPTTEKKQNPLSWLPCLAGILPLAFFGAWARRNN